ncbi:MAG TPA: zinc ribbon domain-containing protein [Syntrophomonadaceae bacterium]|nr:zinc ribbon domain-containing protein [Syntrophomonadaceae bacterium]
MYCKNCRQEIKEGDLFCMNCGIPVEESEAAGENKLKEIDSEKIRGYFNDIKKVLLNMLVSPMTTTQIIARSPLREGSFILAGLLAVTYGLINMWIVQRAFSQIMNTMSAFLGFGYNSFYGMGAEYGPIFGYSLLLFLIALGGLFLGVLLAGKYIFKGNRDPYVAWNVAMVSTIPYVASLLLAVILSYLSLYLSLALILIGVILAILSLFRGINAGMGINFDNSAFATPIAIFAMNLILLIAIKIII